jgi:hypothetical protein
MLYNKQSIGEEAFGLVMETFYLVITGFGMVAASFGMVGFVYFIFVLLWPIILWFITSPFATLFYSPYYVIQYLP